MTSNSALAVRSEAHLQAPTLPPALSTALEGAWANWEPRLSLGIAKRDGQIDLVPDAASAAQLALVPVNHDRLVDRVTAHGMMMAPNRRPDEAVIWVREMCRLLGDLPEAILGEAIDEVIKTSTFLPTVAEIRAKAEPLLARKRRLAARLAAMADVIATGVEILPAAPSGRPWAATSEWVERERCTPEQVAAVLAEFPQFRGPAREVLERIADPEKQSRDERAEYERRHRRLMGDEAWDEHVRWERSATG
jgi:hypothetical protein